jgi:hypothetical protein
MYKTSIFVAILKTERFTQRILHTLHVVLVPYLQQYLLNLMFPSKNAFSGPLSARTRNGCTFSCKVFIIYGTF